MHVFVSNINNILIIFYPLQELIKIILWNGMYYLLEWNPAGLQSLLLEAGDKKQYKLCLHWTIPCTVWLDIFKMMLLKIHKIQFLAIVVNPNVWYLLHTLSFILLLCILPIKLLSISNVETISLSLLLFCPSAFVVY